MAKHDVADGARADTSILVKAALGCTAMIAVFIIVDVIFFAQGQEIKREGGGLETASAVLYGVAFVTFLLVAPARDWLRLFHVPVLFLLFAMRELDFDKAFTDAGILSLKFYSGDSSILSKLIGGAVALFSVYVIYRCVRHGGPKVLAAIKNRQLWPWFAVAAGFLVVATKSFDGLGRKMLDFGIVISKDLDTASAQVEEFGEAFIPVCAVLAILACWKRSKT